MESLENLEGYIKMLSSNKREGIKTFPVLKYADHEIDKSSDINKLFKMEIYKCKNFNTIKKIMETRKNDNIKLNKMQSKIKSINRNEQPDKFESELLEYFNAYKKLYTLSEINPRLYTNILISKLPVTENVKVIKKSKTTKTVVKKETSDIKFKTDEECKSKKRSAKFYNSKDEIIDLILKNETLKKRFPKNIKALTKEEICNIYFSKKS